MRVIALTGVPGTGKTTIAQLLADDATILDANELAEQLDAIEGEDTQREATIVDEARLAERARELFPEGPVIVEGHLAHHCDPDAIVLLRCKPEELRSRMADRGWPDAKIEENAMAEALDALVPELEAPARELDTTQRRPSQAADIVRQVIQQGSLAVDGLEDVGTVDWTDDLL